MNIVKEVNKIIVSQAQVVIKMNELILGINELLNYLKERDMKHEAINHVAESVAQAPHKEPQIKTVLPKKKVK